MFKTSFSVLRSGPWMIRTARSRASPMISPRYPVPTRSLWYALVHICLCTPRPRGRFPVMYMYMYRARSRLGPRQSVYPGVPGAISSTRCPGSHSRTWIHLCQTNSWIRCSLFHGLKWAASTDVGANCSPICPSTCTSAFNISSHALAVNACSDMVSESRVLSSFLRHLQILWHPVASFPPAFVSSQIAVNPGHASMINGSVSPSSFS